MKTETLHTETVSRGVTGGHAGGSTQTPRQEPYDATEFTRDQRTTVDADHVEPPHLSLHLPAETGRDAPDVPGFLPNARTMDGMNFAEHFIIAVFIVTAIALHLWQIVR